MSTTKWADHVHPNVLNLFKDVANDPNEDPLLAEFANQVLDSDFGEDPNYHIRASPLWELSSIKISRELFQKMDSNEGSSCVIELYGHIRLVDDKGNMFTLFKLDSQDPKIVVLDDDYSIILRKPQLGTPRCLPKNMTLHILLCDRIRDVVFFDDSKFLDFTQPVFYDVNDFILLDYDVAHNFLKLESKLEIGFTIFHCAVLAYVGVTVRNDGIDLGSDVEVTGHFTTSIKLRNEEVSQVLFDEPMKFDFNSATELCVLAVPVYSPLKIKAELKFDEEPIVSVLEFKPRDTKYESVDQEILGHKCRILVSVTWEHACHKLPENYLREWDNASGSESEDLDGGDGENISFEKLQIMEETSDRIGFYIQPELQMLRKRRWIVSSHPNDLVEVFSVSIWSFDDVDSPLSISGSILSYYTAQSLDHFSHNKMKPGILYPNVTDNCMGTNFCMDFDLEDSKGQEISRGFLEYDELRADGWYDRRMCSVVPGKQGYAAAYYTIFQDAVKARLKIMLMSGNRDVVQLCGSIHARYNNYSYSSLYEKEYYQSTLFEKGKSELVNDGGEVPLTKSVVSVPSNASLIVKVDLFVMVDGKCIETLKGKATFKPRKESEEPEEPKIIGGSKSSSTYHLLVSVVWGNPEYGLNHCY